MEHTLAHTLLKLEAVKVLQLYIIEPLSAVVLEYFNRDPETCNNIEHAYDMPFRGCLAESKDEEVYENIPLHILSKIVDRAQAYIIYASPFAESIHHVHYRPIENVVYVHWRKDAIKEAPEYTSDSFQVLHYRAFERACTENYPVTKSFKHFARDENNDITQILFVQPPNA